MLNSECGGRVAFASPKEESRVIPGRELGGGVDLALIRTLPTEPSEWGRMRLSA